MSLDAPVGVTAVLGPNGAGKSTLLEAIACLAPSTFGSVHIGAEAVDATSRADALRQIGFVPQHDDLIASFTVEEFVRYAAWLKGVDRKQTAPAVEAALDVVEMLPHRRAKTGTLSGGMRQRVSIAASLVHDPAIWILDEPTVGLDPEQRAGFRSLLRRQARTRVVLLSTHLVEDVSWAAGTCVILGDSRVLFRGSIREIQDAGRPAESLADATENGYLAILRRAGEGP